MDRYEGDGDPTRPQLSATFPAYARSIFVSDDNAFILGNGLGIIDISDPSMPTLRDYNETIDGWKVAISDDLAYVAGSINGLQVVDISDLSSPKKVGGNTSFHTTDVAVGTDYVFVTSGDALFITDRFRHPLRFETAPIVQNGQARISVSGPIGTMADIQRSSDLLDWADWKSVTLGDQPIELLDTDLEANPRRFYRAVSR